MPSYLSASESYLASKSVAFIIPVVSSFLFIYVAVRAYYIPYMCDETYTFTEYVAKSNLFNSEYTLVSTNNHLLNTWLMWIIYNITGYNEFALRLPNVLSVILYLYFSIKIIASIASPLLKTTSFFLLALNPFVLDFFSLARGYGISLGIMMGSLYYLKCFLENRDEQKLWLSFLFLSIAMLANLTLMYLFIPLFFTSLIFFIIEKPQIKPGWMFVLTALLVTYAGYILIQLKGSNSLYGGYWYETVETLVSKSLYRRTYSSYVNLPLQILSLALLFTGGIYMLKDIYKSRTWTNSFLYWCISLFVGCFILQFAINIFFHTAQFLIHRTAVFLLPLFSLIIIHLLEKRRFNRMLKQVVCIFITGSALLHFFLSMNLRGTVLWHNLP